MFGFLLMVAVTVTRAAPAAPTFVDISDTSGVSFRHANSATAAKYLVETMGGGVAAFDANGDGKLDVFITNGAGIQENMSPGTRPDKSDPRFWNRLYVQQADGTFRDSTASSGLSGAADGTYTMGVAAGDYDNDGSDDLYVTAFDSNKLYRNEGGGRFRDVTATAGVAASGWSTSAGWFDYDRDGDLDLLVGRYMEWSFADNLYCGERRPGHRAYCHPDNYKPISNILFRNNGDGTFTDVSVKSGVAALKGKALGLAFADYDADGWTDVYIANDSVQCFLLRNKGDGTFSEESLIGGVGYNEDGKTFAGMGTDFADFDNDSHPDIFVTALSNETYPLFRNAGDGTFVDSTVKTGVGQATMLYSGWGTKLIDYDNDGWKDLFVAQGHVLDTIELTSPHLRYLQPPLLLRNNARGRLERVPAETAGPVFGKLWAGRGAAFGDLDNDGDIDAVVVNCGQPAYVLRNDGGNRNRWIGLRLTGTKSNRRGIGAVVKVTGSSGLAQHTTVNTAGSYLSSNDPRVLVGLGSDTTAKTVEIRWPSGIVQTLNGLKADTWHDFTEPKQ